MKPGGGRIMPAVTGRMYCCCPLLPDGRAVMADPVSASAGPAGGSACSPAGAAPSGPAAAEGCVAVASADAVAEGAAGSVPAGKGTSPVNATVAICESTHTRARVYQHDILDINCAMTRLPLH